MNLNIPWRIGMNIRELVYYGEPGTNMQQVNKDLRRFQIEKLHAIGVQQIRFFAPHHKVSTERSLQLIGETLDLLKEFDMQAVICLSDSLSHSGHFFLGDIEYHNMPHHGHLNRNYWIDRQWEYNYLPFVKTLVERFKNHDSVLIWELGNEHAVLPQDGSEIAHQASRAYLEFVRTMTSVIRGIDANALIGTGLINSRHVFHVEDHNQLVDFSRELHSIVDAVSLHIYEKDTHERNRLEIDTNVAGDLRKLLYIGELGANIRDHDKPREQFLSEQINLWRSRGAFMVMPWAFNATELSLADDYGISRRFNDFDALSNVIEQSRGSTTSFVPAALLRVIPRQEPKLSSTSQEVTRFEVMTQLAIRVAPHRDAPHVERNGKAQWLMPGEIIEVDVASRSETDDHVWWRHSDGWSAERPLAATDVYLKSLQSSVMVHDSAEKFLFQQLPVEINNISWLQYFGATQFAREVAFGQHIDIGLPATSYSYAQGFHGGLDFGNTPGKDLIIRAGVNGIVAEIHNSASYFKPNYVVVQSGPWAIIYGHLGAITHGLVKGQSVSPQSVIGSIAYRQGAHLHLEVRNSARQLIVNPLKLMSPTLCDSVMQFSGRWYSPSGTIPDPLSQVDIELGGAWRAPWPQPAA